MNKIDHFVFFHPNLREGINYIERLTGIEAKIAGQHLGRGTWNAIFTLSGNSYFEIISPDPAQNNLKAPRWMGIDHFKQPKLIRWAVSVKNLKAMSHEAKAKGMALGMIETGSRQLQNGNTLKWQLTAPSMVDYAVPTPFLIEWSDASHPTMGKEPQAFIEQITLFHQDPERLKKQMAWLNIDCQVIKGEKPAIQLHLASQTICTIT